MTSSPRKTAVILFNLGGPDSLEAVQPFLFNLFYDPVIIGAPKPIRWLLARKISRKRAPTAQEIYRHLGGKSPLLEQTTAQAQALQAEMQRQLRQAGAEESEVRPFLCMRYWHPMTRQVVEEVKAYGPDLVLLLPLYPQYSIATTGSSVKEWEREARRQSLSVPTRLVCCWPTLDGFIDAQAHAVRKAIQEVSPYGEPRVLFSAHGLPKKMITDGDPYQWQVEQGAAAIVSRMGLSGVDWLVTYQSRVGPLEWLSPFTDDEIRRAGEDQVPLVVLPLAFVSEHSETLVELDIEYRHLAESCGVPAYHRIETVQTNPIFIQSLAQMAVERILSHQDSACAHSGARLCPSQWGNCPCPKPPQPFGGS